MFVLNTPLSTQTHDSYLSTNRYETKLTKLKIFICLIFLCNWPRDCLGPIAMKMNSNANTQSQHMDEIGLGPNEHAFLSRNFIFVSCCWAARAINKILQFVRIRLLSNCLFLFHSEWANQKRKLRSNMQCHSKFTVTLEESVELLLKRQTRELKINELVWVTSTHDEI